MRSFGTNAWPAPWNLDVPLKDAGPSFLSIWIPVSFSRTSHPSFCLCLPYLVTQAVDVLSQKMSSQVYHCRMLSRQLVYAFRFLSLYCRLEGDGQWDCSAGEGACCQTWWSELHTGPAWWREKKRAPESSPLTSTCALKINDKQLDAIKIFKHLSSGVFTNAVQTAVTTEGGSWNRSTFFRAIGLHHFANPESTCALRGLARIPVSALRVRVRCTAAGK